MSEEEWRPVPGFEGYEVSDMGRVRSSRGRDGLRKNGGGRVLRGSTFGKGYVGVSLRRSGETHQRYVHALVMEAFVGPCPPGLEVRHFPDGNPRNNALSNLSYGTRSQNACDRHAQGTMTLAKLTDEQVALIRSTPPGTVGLAKRMGVHRHTIHLARSGVTWKHVAASGAIQ